MNQFITTKIWKKTLKKLKMLSAIKGKSMVLVLDELVSASLNELVNTDG